MTKAKSVQIDSAADVVTWYENWMIPAFAVCYGNDIQFAYDQDSTDEGSDMLSQWLEMLKKSGTAAIYTLRVYKLKEDQEIDSRTPYKYSVNFRLQDKPAGYLPADVYQQYGGNGHQLYSDLMQTKVENARLQEQMKILIQQVSQENQPDNDPDENEGEMGFLKKMEFLLYKTIEPIAPQLGQRLAEWLVPPLKSGKVAGVTEPAGTPDQRCSEALQRAKTVDAEFYKVLEAIADLAENENETYLFYRKALLKNR